MSCACSQITARSRSSVTSIEASPWKRSCDGSIFSDSA